MLEFNVQTLAFLLFSLFVLGGAAGVVTTRNLIHATLYLILSLFGVAGLFVLMSAPFLAVVQVVVYIGAIAILIVFAVMLTRSMTRLRDLYNHQWAASAVVAVLLFVLLAVGVILPVWGVNGAQTPTEVSDVVADTVELGKALVDRNQYVLPFELASLLLTAAMIGAIVVARDDE
ncbi:MAG: NADH-quinone oxidoreductase subunit J [Chloroflexi bacterium]|nr:NADH-quinone oxidoreductase subunit J [Chloroflexota bacterium]